MQLKLANLLRNAATAFVVLAIGIVLSAGAVYFMLKQMERDARQKFARVVVEAEDAIATRIRAYSDLLIGVRALFIASDFVTRDEFRSYVESLDLNRRYPGIQVIHYAQRVSAAQRPAFEALVRNDRSVDPRGYPDFSVKPPGNRPEYFIVQYVEPMTGNEAALGLDLGGDAVRLVALERTRDTGQLSASGTIALALDPRRHPGFAMRVPIYRKGMPAATVEQRREAFAGMISASFVVIDLMRGVLSEQFLRTMRIRIHDAGFLGSAGGLQPPTAENLMFDGERLLPAESRSNISDGDLSELTKIVGLEVGGRRWNLHFSAREGFIPPSERLLPWATLFAGALISLLLFGMIRSLAASGRHAVFLADRITQDLRKSEASLTEAQRMTQQLIEALPNPIFFKGTDGRYLGVNRAWEKFFGVPRETFIGKTVHDLYPDNQEVADRLHAMDQVLWQHPGSQVYETSITTLHGMRHDAIYYKATFTRADGSVAGLIGTIIDITERKQADVARNQLAAIVEHANAAIITRTLDGRIQSWNAGAEKLLGFTATEAIGKQISFTLPRGRPPNLQRNNENLLRGEVVARESDRITKDGRVINVLTSHSPVRDDAGNIVGASIILQDITAVKLAQTAVRESEERYRATFDNAPVGIMHTAIDDDRILRANAKLCELLGYTQDELVRMHTDQFIHPEYVGADQPKYRDAMLKGELDTYSSERLYQRKDGSDLWVNRTVSLVKDAAGKPLYFIRIIEDISERMLSNRSRAMEHAVTRVLAESTTQDEAMSATLQTICEGLGWACGAHWQWDEDAELLRCVKTWHVDSKEVADFSAASRQETNEAPRWVGGAPNTRTSGLVRGVWFSGNPVWLPDVARQPGFRRGQAAAKADLHCAFAFPILAGGQPLGIMEFYGRDIKQPDETLLQVVRAIGSQLGQYLVRQQAEERVRHLAHYDELTGLPNRTMFNERLSHALAHARRTETSLAILFIDLDRFKNINDTLGHESGDRVLKEVAQRLRDCLRESDTVGRLGGDEFVVLIEEPPRPVNAGVVAQKILAAMGTPFLVQAQEFHITASIGISSYPGDGADMLTLMKNADIAMYRAKEQGKNNAQFYSAQINDHSIERLTLESSLRRALERNEFLLHYQPKLDIGSGRITGVEALLRWQQPAQGLIPPAQFIRLAEETGLIVPIGEWVLRTACAQNKAWQQQGLAPVRVAVNLSPRQFAQANLLEAVARVLKQTGLDPAFLELEITESVVMSNPEQAVILLRRLKAFGIHLAIDDFGTGYSSLNYLKRFPLDTLKIDRTFIRDLPGDSDDAAITQAILAMAHSLRLNVVAEGVETAEQMRFLRDSHCDEIQGYYFSRPQLAEDIAPLLRDFAAAGRILSLS